MARGKEQVKTLAANYTRKIVSVSDSSHIPASGSLNKMDIIEHI
jgi:hypothetical protein